MPFSSLLNLHEFGITILISFSLHSFCKDEFGITILISFSLHSFCKVIFNFLNSDRQL